MIYFNSGKFLFIERNITRDLKFDLLYCIL